MKNKVLIIIAAVLLCCNSVLARHLKPEKYYQYKWCKENNGQLEVVLNDGARIDCLTQHYAIEFDFASKWAESIGQSLYYGIKTSKKPAIVLIMERPKLEKRYYDRLMTVAKKYKITVFTMEK